MSTRVLSIGRAGAMALMAAGAIGASPALQAADGGMRVVKDPVTGQLRAPTAEEFKAMQDQEDKAKASQRSAPAVRTMPRRNAHGGLSHDVGERFMTYSVLKRDAAGNMTMQCVTGAEAADKAVNESQTPALPVANQKGGHEHQ